MKRICLWLGFLPLVCVAVLSAAAGEIAFVCDAKNELYVALKRERAWPRYADALEAVKKLPEDSALLILADGYPQQRTQIDPGVWELAAWRGIRLYVEFPDNMPGQEVGPTRTITIERGVVATDAFGPNLAEGCILALHDCHYVPVAAAEPLLVMARVAGFDTAVYGLPKKADPILFAVPEKKWLVATTKLSDFNRARFGPAQDWQAVWQFILTEMMPSHGPFTLDLEPAVRPSYNATDKLPKQAERKAFTAAAQWLVNSRLLVPPLREPAIHASLRTNGETARFPEGKQALGDGSLGILEGYASGILADGQQLQRLPLRADCNAESAMVLALDAQVNGTGRSKKIAGNLLDFVYYKSGICGGPRADEKHGAFGLIGWGDVSPAWLVASYGDDEARAILATILASSCLKSSQWQEPLAKALLANFRTTGKKGFRGDRIDLPQLAGGWKAFHERDNVNLSPHFESYLWACYLWAYRETGYQPFLDQTKAAIATMMQAYPKGWRLGDNSERSRMLLCLAWLVRLEDTPQHREWVETVANDLLERQQPSGTIHEWLGGTGGGHYQIPQSNEAYGTGETPLIQNNGDPVSDQLYTTGFALFALHEAVAATGDKHLQEGEDKLADFLCRIQIRSEQYPWLNGWWFRAFDDRRWEYWASSADIGWGPWSLESGWAQAWTATTLALRAQKTTFWDLTAKSGVKPAFAKWQPVMLPE